MGEGNRLDDLARDLASGTISRRTALRRLAAGALGIGLAAAPNALADGIERGRCPKERRCDGKCCPKGAKCRNGRCKCKSGLKKCGRKCVDLQTSANHCGACGNPCAAGETCLNGSCIGCQTPEDCPVPGNECQAAVCIDGTCGTASLPDGTACTGGTCFSGECQPEACGDNVIQGTEDCDGADLGGATCTTLGFSGGTLACASDCTYDTSGCTI